ncbi:hypothetical protein BV20DRAFT_982916 [Pilatotrama ljubarskyi]|nr:hypothetical protein BV20DRAFT_982916 [Pilatotrama ljubarskyi]
MTFAEIQSTPVAQRYSGTHDHSGYGPGSLAGNHQTLAQYRLASAEDMAHKAVRMEAAAFADRFFPVPSDATRPEWASNIFNKLAPGGDLKEIDIVEEFMKVVNTEKLAPGLKMAASTDRPDMQELDEFRQKVDAAFFKTAAVPSDGRPHWVDQLVSEGTVLSQLNEKEVRFVPTLVCHGDIRKQTTVTPEVWDEQNPPKPAEHRSESPSPCSSKPSLLSSSRKLSLPSSSRRPSLSSSTRKPSLPSSSAKPSLSSSATLAEPQASSTSRKRSRSEMESDATLGDREDCPLRRHMHYRIVVEEVAMPLSEIQCGRQLVQVVFDCLLAHWDATEKAQLLHRDVSGGNVLILPRLTRDSRSGKTWLKWRGLLADWEMSKPIHDKEELRRPRQPPRTGTWQFLSVGMLGHKPRAPGIPDELESLLYVILYYAVRYLSSNCEDAAAFLETFFDAHTVANGVSTCGQAKLMAMEMRGHIEVEKRVRLKFNSPLDTVFSELLPCFKAHYKVQNYRDEQSDSTGAPRSSRYNNPSLPPSPPSPSPQDAITAPFIAGDVFEMQALMQTEKRAQQEDNSPTPADEHDASLLANHRWMVGVLARVLTSTEWRPDRVGDRVPADYQPQYDVAPPDGPADSTMKRRMTMAQFTFRSDNTGLSAARFRSAPPK